MQELKQQLGQPLHPELKERFEREQREDRFEELLALGCEEQRKKRWPRNKRLRASAMRGK